jgi:hypothetical protein
MVSVSIENAGLGEAELERALAQILARPEIQERRLGLRELFWDNNQITVSFAKLLDRLVDLRLLSLSGCIGDADESLNLVTDFLTRNETVRDLRVCGTLHRTLIPDQMTKLLLPIKERNRTILQLQLSHNQFDQSVFDSLADVLLQNRRIVKLCIEDIRLPHPAVLETFLKRIQGRGARLEIPVPRTDIDEMTRKKTIDDSGIEKLLGTFKTLAAGIPPTRATMEEAPGEGGSEFMIAGEEAIEEWGVEIDPIPEPDNAAILGAFEEEFTLEKLVAKLKAAV